MCICQEYNMLLRTMHTTDVYMHVITMLVTPCLRMQKPATEVPYSWVKVNLYFHSVAPPAVLATDNGLQYSLQQFADSYGFYISLVALTILKLMGRQKEQWRLWQAS